MKLGVVTVLAAVSVCTAAMAEQFTTYHIGNSLSQDMYSRVFPKLAKTYQESKANTFAYGYHFRPATSLTFMNLYPLGKPDASDPTHTKSDVNRTTQGQPDTNLHPWNEALDGYRVDAVTMQPYYPGDSVTSNQGTDTNAISAMITETRKNPGNQQTRFFVYAAWPGVTHGNPSSYSTAYLTSSANNASQSSTQTRDYMKNLTTAARTANPTASVSAIPVGEVLYALDVKMRAGEIPGFTSMDDLHRDQYHMNSTGQNIAAYTVYATIFKESPVGLPMDWFESYPNNPGPFGVWNENAKYFVEHAAPSAQALQIMQQTVWDTVNSSEMIGYTNVPEPVSGAAILGGMIFLGTQRSHGRSR